MATIFRADSPVARCRVCGVQRQFHAKSDVPHSANRDHDFEAETVADFEPGDLTPEQLVREIGGTTARADATNDMPLADRLDERARLCRVELKARVLTMLGVDFDDLEGALA